MPTKHCRACQQEQTACLCNTCKRDSLYKAPACCSGRKCPIRMIKKYRKKPVVVDAFQFFYDDPGTLEWAEEALARRIIDFDYLGDLYIKTLEGNELVSDGDYIIRGVKGEFYPCKPDIFEMTYEEADKPHRTCSVCTKTDGVIYSADPPAVRCTVDGKFHAPDFECTLNLDAGVTNADSNSQ